MCSILGHLDVNTTTMNIHDKIIVHAIGEIKRDFAKLLYKVVGMS